MNENKLTCALVAASDFDGKDFLRRAAMFDCVVAVDAGLVHLQGIGCQPDFILGDFDSLGYVPNVENIEVHPAKKDKSDLELAFDWACAHGYSSVVVYGALGGRLDHTVANMQMCARFAETGMNVRLIGVDCIVDILVGPGELRFPMQQQGTVSVFSAVEESRGVTETGMEYSLDHATLSNRTSLGLSNELIGRPATVSVEGGTLFVFHSVTE